MPHRRLQARVRAEYVWPYPGVDPSTWYDVISCPDDAPGWFWLKTRPTRTYIAREHVDVRERYEPDAAPREAGPVDAAPAVVVEDARREVRLKPHVLRRYGGILPGIWMRAAEVVALLRPPALASPGERRRQRLSGRDFEFRTVRMDEQSVVPPFGQREDQ